MANFDRQAYIDAFNKEKYDRICIRLPVGCKEQIKAQAEAKGLSMAAYIWSLVQEDKTGE